MYYTDVSAITHTSKMFLTSVILWEYRVELFSSSSSKFYFQQNTTIKQ